MISSASTQSETEDLPSVQRERASVYVCACACVCVCTYRALMRVRMCVWNKERLSPAAYRINHLHKNKQIAQTLKVP